MVATQNAWRHVRQSVPAVVAAGSGFAFVLGAATQNPGLLGGGAVALCSTWREWQQYVPGRQGSQSPQTQSAACQAIEESCAPAKCVSASASEPTPASATDVSTPANATNLVDQFIDSSRYALLLSPDTVAHLTDEERHRVINVMEDAMSIVPEGQVLIGVSAERATWGGGQAGATNDGVQSVEGFYVDRFAVTNAQYQHFVDAGTYEEFAYWHEEALPALFEFVDRTEFPGPRNWENGRFRLGEDNLPVVGVSWYEASAYARWVGKRLLTDAEWTKVAAWPIETTPGNVAQRRYPWGDSFESRRANLWSSSKEGPVAVDEFPQGASISGVHQLIGNTWEWTQSEFVEGAESSGGSECLRTLHGGAFNTYFENQATCHFRSGEAPLARRANIGIRLGLSLDGMIPLDEDQA